MMMIIIIMMMMLIDTPVLEKNMMMMGMILMMMMMIDILTLNPKVIKMMMKMMLMMMRRRIDTTELDKNMILMIIMIELGMCVAAAKAVKTANPSPHATAEEEKESVKPEKPKEPDIEYTMDSAPGLAYETYDDNLEPVALRRLPHDNKLHNYDDDLHTRS